MNAPDLRRIDEAAPDAGPRSPTVFVRTLSTPPGLPWDQARAAALEARVGAPLPLADVVYRLRRLEAWSPGRPARYAACYVRAAEAGETFSTTVEVDGRTLPIQFLSAAERGRQARRLGILAAVVAVTVLSLGSAISSALAVRADTSDRLGMAEQRAALKLRQAQTQARLHEEARMLDAAGARHRALGDFLTDLAWASAAKAPGAHINALHWERGYVAVEVRGDAPPFTAGDRAVIRADKPIRPGVWLWGVGPAGSAAASSANAPSSVAAAP
ncbi:MAG: hypothetical protein P4L64_15225 [Caulobacteraceae bacterium]|nr:hypothetical protein [Caulobacteraceae bacterium]